MNLSKLWVIDPKDQSPSVSLSILVYSLVIYLVLGVLNVVGTISTMGPFQELFFSAVALYFGRRLNIGGKVIEANSAESVENKLTQ